MLTTAEIIRSTYGVWRLAHADPSGMSYFDATPEGFWRSFRVAILIAPAFALLVAFDYWGPADPDAVPLAAGSSRIVAVEVIAYAINWMAYPLATYYLALALDREREYVGYIVAYNWSSVLQVGVLVPVVAIATSELLPWPLSGALQLATELGLLAYAWFVAKTALKIGGLPAAGLVALDLMLSVLVYSIRNAMIY